MSSLIESSQKTQLHKQTNDRITVEALKYYVPLFHRGDKALAALAVGNVSAGSRNLLESEARLKDLTVNRIASLAGPLITRKINKLIKGSHLSGKEDLFNILYYAGINGMVKGLRHFDVDKLDKSSTNYLFQWIVTYAKKELSVIEAPFGVAPSRFQRYKKVSAVRKKLSEQLGRYASNDEVLAFFHSGQADLKTMSGRKKDSDKPYAVNKNMTIDIIEEQENFEKNLNHVNLLDPLDDYHAEITMSEDSAGSDLETPFRVFLDSLNFTDAARAVLLSDLQQEMDVELSNLAANLSASDYKNISNRWRDLLRDVHGPFFAFLTSESAGEFAEFDKQKTIENMRLHETRIKKERYLPLFIGGRMEKNND